MELPVINDAKPAKVYRFYKTLMYSVKLLETLGKLDKVSGMARSVMEKLRGIKADLVKGEEEWRQSDYERLSQFNVLGLVDSPEYDQKEVYAEFQEQLVRSKEGWYETGLP